MKTYTIHNTNNPTQMTIKADSPEEASFTAMKNMGYVIEEKKEEIKYPRYFFCAHMDKNFVKVGDRVKQYKTKIGTIGNANYPFNNIEFAHDHMGAFQKISIETFYSYIFGWSKSDVKKYYFNPYELGIDFEKMYPETKLDIGNPRGYDWLQSIKNSKGQHIGYHPALDINDIRGGNIEMKEKQSIYAPCDGVVIHEKRTWFSNRGWGNLIIIKED